MKPARRSFLATVLALPFAAGAALRAKPKATRAELLRAFHERDWARRYYAWSGIAMDMATPGTDTTGVTIVDGGTIETAELKVSRDGKTWERIG